MAKLKKKALKADYTSERWPETSGKDPRSSSKKKKKKEKKGKLCQKV